jgi:endo-1,4-beta-xylanase
MRRLAGAVVGLAIALVCAPAAAARQNPAEPGVRTSRDVRDVRLRSGAPATFTMRVRPYRSLAVRLRSSGCRLAPTVIATTGGVPSRLIAHRAWGWKTLSERGGPPGRVTVTLRLLTRQKRCTVLVDALRVQERIQIGAAMWTQYMGRDERYERRAEESFGSVTPENDMKMLFLQPREGEFDFAAADRLVNWARARGKAVHGHTLIYGAQLPDWFKRTDLFGRSVYTRPEMLAILENHVRTVVSHFRGRVASWDVVNEAFLRDGSLRPNLFLDVIGPDYIEFAFRWAREADPHAKLFYNDAGAELINPMSDAIHVALAELKAAGTPIDGIGFQAHLDIGSPPGAEAMVANLRRFAGLDLDVAFSELDVSIEARDAPADPAAAQAALYADVAAACVAVPRCTRLTLWGVGDAVSWRGAKRAPLPFDTEYRPKPAWTALTSALGQG